MRAMEIINKIRKEFPSGKIICHKCQTHPLLIFDIIYPDAQISDAVVYNLALNKEVESAPSLNEMLIAEYGGKLLLDETGKLRNT